MEYTKIHSLWKRQGWYFEENAKKDPSKQAGRQSFIEGDYAIEGLGNIKEWDVEEKVDGTNIRITYDENGLVFNGRTALAQIPTPLYDHLLETFTLEKMEEVFPSQDGKFPQVTLYGEGYGPKIQACGRNYRKTPGFILFDVRVSGWWLKREDVSDIANKLEVPMVPQLGKMTAERIVEFIKSNPLSLCSAVPQVMEGVVCRSSPLMFFRNGQPVMFKLKCKDYN
jgi:ATP-dependent RNA circularization protein (DNA/RNA ligase family)